MCQPSPSGSGKTNGSRQVSLAVAVLVASVLYQRGRRRSTGCGRRPRRQWCRSSDTADADPLVEDAVPAVDSACRTSATAVVAAHHRAGPDREVVEARRRRARSTRPGSPSRRRSRETACPTVAPRVPPARVPERARRLEEEQVVEVAVVGDPGVPDPVVRQSEHRTSHGRGRERGSVAVRARARPDLVPGEQGTPVRGRRTRGDGSHAHARQESPPELWAEVSDVAALTRHLGEFGEIRITRTEPESVVEWEGDRTSGTVRARARRAGARE